MSDPYTPAIWSTAEDACAVLNHMGTLYVDYTCDPTDGCYEAALFFGEDGVMVSRQLNLEKTVMILYCRVANTLWAAVNGKVVII